MLYSYWKKRKSTICCIPIVWKESLQYAVFLLDEKKIYSMLYSFWLKRKPTVCCIPIGWKKAYSMLYSYWLKRKPTVCCIPIGCILGEGNQALQEFLLSCNPKQQHSTALGNIDHTITITITIIIVTPFN